MTVGSDVDKLITKCEQMLKDGKDFESVVQFLRRNRGRKITSIEVIALLLDIPISKAKILIHTTQTWSDVRKRDEMFEHAVIAALERLGVQQDG